MQCFLCLEEDNNVMKVCACALAHNSCLQNWCSYEGIASCPICGIHYKKRRPFYITFGIPIAFCGIQYGLCHLSQHAYPTPDTWWKYCFLQYGMYSYFICNHPTTKADGMIVCSAYITMGGELLTQHPLMQATSFFTNLVVCLRNALIGYQYLDTLDIKSSSGFVSYNRQQDGLLKSISFFCCAGFTLLLIGKQFSSINYLSK